jgi:hypothetical protein
MKTLAPYAALTNFWYVEPFLIAMRGEVVAAFVAAVNHEPVGLPADIARALCAALPTFLDHLGSNTQLANDLRSYAAEVGGGSWEVVDLPAWADWRIGPDLPF